MADKMLANGATFAIRCGDSLELLKTMESSSVDSIVTDPPYGLSNHSMQDVMDCLRAWLDGREYIHGKKGFMGHSWDGWVPGPEIWREALRVLKPGGHLLCFAGTRTMDLMSMAIRLGGFELRDNIGFANEGANEDEVDHAPLMAWVYGSGFPKSMDVSKAIDREAGAERKVVGRRLHPTLVDAEKMAERAGAAHGGNEWRREWDITSPATDAAKQWQGFGTALKPAWEPIIIARKPISGTIASNVQKHGTGAINIDGCRVPVDEVADASQLRVMNRSQRDNDLNSQHWGMSKNGGDQPQVVRQDGRFPANLIHDGSPGVLAAFPEARGQQGDLKGHNKERKSANGCYGTMGAAKDHAARRDSGSAARFFYCAKTSPTDRHEGVCDASGRATIPHASTLRQIENLKEAGALSGNTHPTVKPTDLMRYLSRLATPPRGIVLDLFAGSGSTGKGAILEGFRFIGLEVDPGSAVIAEQRCRFALSKYMGQ